MAAFDVDALVAPDATDTAAPAVTPEVAAQETSEVQKPEVEQAETSDEPKEREETADERVARLEKAERAMRRQIDRLRTDKARARGEAEAYRSRAEQIEAMVRGQQQPESQQQLTPQQIEQRAVQLARMQLSKERFDAQCNDFVEQGSKALGKDFKDALEVVSSEAPLFDGRGAPTPFLQALFDCDDRYKVLGYLKDNPDEAAELAELPPLRIARRLAKIESNLAKPQEKPVSAAPKPIKPVTGAGNAQKAVEDMDADELWNIVRSSRKR